jgi:hypothetical protein
MLVFLVRHEHGSDRGGDRAGKCLPRCRRSTFGRSGLSCFDLEPVYNTSARFSEATVSRVKESRF